MTASNSRSSVDGVSGGILGSARASRARCGASPQRIWLKCKPVRNYLAKEEKVRAGEGASASTRGACAPQKLTGLRGQF